MLWRPGCEGRPLKAASRHLCQTPGSRFDGTISLRRARRPQMRGARVAPSILLLFFFAVITAETCLKPNARQNACRASRPSVRHEERLQLALAAKLLLLHNCITSATILSNGGAPDRSGVRENLMDASGTCTCCCCLLRFSGLEKQKISKLRC